MVRTNSRFEKYGLKAVFALIVLLPALFLNGCSGGKKELPQQKMAVPVTAAIAVQKTVPVQLQAIGNVEAYASVSVKSQLGGQLTKVHFREGQDVNRGAALFTIDPRPFEAALRQAEAALAKDSAQMENARQETRRYEELSQKGYVSQSQYDQMRTNSDALEAVVRADRALVENAKVQLGYCFIYSPISGRTGSLLANEGNIIKANADTPMVVINQIQPVYVNFSLPEQYLSEVRKHMAAGKIKVDAVIAKEEAQPVPGILTFVDNAVDSATGTLRFKGTFANMERRLWPGQFVRVVVILAEQPDAVTVPSQAVQTGQQGQFVYAVKKDLTVESRPVVVDRMFNGEAIIAKGVEAGERVVTDGQLRLVPGAKVEIKNAGEGKK